MVVSDRGFYFYTRNGNKYLYNDISGSVILADDKQNQEKSGQSIVSDDLNVQNMPVDVHQIEHFIQTEGYKSCILIVTEECNLRCKYCAYSGDYRNHRSHRDRYMTQDIAERAIMKYFEGFNSVKMSNPYMVPAIGFYGGEPLLKFDLIKNAVALARNLYSRNIIFNLTTNGTIMSDEMLDFFVENSVLLAFSLNGPKKEHDRLRVYSNGAGSFDHVMKTLAKIRQKDIEYYRKNCSLIVIYDTGTDLMATSEFFTKHEAELPAVARVNSVQATYTDWYSRYSKEQHSRHNKSLQQCKDLYFSLLLSKTKPPKFLEMLIGGPYRLLLMRPQNVNHRPDILQFTGTCVPGMKIAVDPSGSFHCCEKVNDRFPIGDVDTGIDLRKIRKLIQNYRDNIYSGCSSCPIARNCPTCFSFFCGDGIFAVNPAGYCDLVRDTVRKRYEELWSLLEAGIPEDSFLRIRPASIPDF